MRSTRSLAARIPIFGSKLPALIEELPSAGKSSWLEGPKCSPSAIVLPFETENALQVVPVTGSLNGPLPWELDQIELAMTEPVSGTCGTCCDDSARFDLVLAVEQNVVVAEGEQIALGRLTPHWPGPVVFKTSRPTLGILASLPSVGSSIDPPIPSGNDGDDSGSEIN